jgi:hypothetical protein
MRSRHKTWAIAAGAAMLAAAVALPVMNAATASAAANPYGDPNLVSMFDGTTLNGWTSWNDGGYIVKDGTIHTTGNKRGHLRYNTQVGSFRWIFSVRQTVPDHEPSVLFWGTTTPLTDALQGIQFEPPNSHAWDYRPGHNNADKALFTQVAHTHIDTAKWAQCEIIANQTTGVARMACGQLAGTATSTCTAVEVSRFKDVTAGRVGPVAIQVHNAGIQDEYRDLYIESPVKTKPDEFITTGNKPCPGPGTTTPSASSPASPSASPSASEMPPAIGGTFKVVSRLSGKVLGVAGASTAEGAKVVQQTYAGTAGQQWEVVDAGGGYVKLVNKASGKVLDVTAKATTDGAAVIQWTDRSATNQQWKAVPVAGGYTKLVNRNSGKVLDVAGASTADGAAVIQWTDKTATNQQWMLAKP